MIVCNKCAEMKSITEYRKPSINKCGTKGICKSCKNKADSKYWKEKVKDPKFKQQHNDRQWRYKEQHTAYMKKYDVENKDKKRAYMMERYRNDDEVRLQSTIRNRIYGSLKAQNKDKKYKSEEYLGCSVQDYKKYLENQFDENMSWDNYGAYWEIDHIHQLSLGGGFEYTNTRPLPISENRKRKKGRSATS